jgi:hypothetical protein
MLLPARTAARYMKALRQNTKCAAGIPLECLAGAGRHRPSAIEPKFIAPGFHNFIWGTKHDIAIIAALLGGAGFGRLIGNTSHRFASHHYRADVICLD